MSAAESLNLLDFTSPRRPSTDALRQLSAWHTSACAVIQDSWGSLLARPVTLQANGLEPQQLRKALTRLPEDGLALCYALGEELIPGVLVLSARQVQGLMADLLDVPGESWPAPRKLTSVEEATLELLYQKIAEGLSDAWPGPVPLPCRFLEAASRPQRTRMFLPETPLLVARIKLTSRFGEETASWLMPKEVTERLISEHLGDALPDDRAVHPDLQQLTERVPLEVVVQLGKVSLSMSQIENLSLGDVLLLDQTVTQPLLATVEGRLKWAGHPQRIGSRQAFVVTHLIEDESNLSVLLSSSGENPGS